MKITLKYLLITGLLFVLFQECKKYPNGPSISFRSAETRVTGEWKIDKYFKNTNEDTQAFIDFYGTDFIWSFEKGGHYHVHGKYTDEGTWKLGADKTTLRVLPDAAGASEDIYDIQRLTNKELWIKIRYSTGESETFQFKQ